jgi:hypothetical protein
MVASNIFMEHVEEITLDTAGHKPTKQLRYVDSYVVWPHRPASLQQFFYYVIRFRPTIKFAMEIETNNTLPPSAYWS